MGNNPVEMESARNAYPGRRLPLSRLETLHRIYQKRHRKRCDVSELGRWQIVAAALERRASTRWKGEGAVFEGTRAASHVRLGQAGEVQHARAGIAPRGG